jgi:Mce-associated membrane protein
MAKTPSKSDAGDHAVEHKSSAGNATAENPAGAAAVPGENAPAKKGRFGLRGKAKKADATDTTEAGGTDEGGTAANAAASAKAAAAAKAASAKAGAAAKTTTSAKGDKTSKGDKAGKAKTRSGKSAQKGPALSGAARLARVVTALGLIAVLLAVLLVVQLVKGPGNGAERAALEDRKEAARSQAEISVARLFSFDYKTLDADFAAQRAQATGDFAGEIDKVTNPAVRPLATKEHVVVQAVSVASATVDDPGPDVQVIVFLNQAVTLDLLPAPRLDRQRLLVSMRLVDGGWKVSGVKAL